jgi:hypothetical protein
MCPDSDLPRTDSDVQAAVKNLFLGAAPEREQELSNFWSGHQMRFNLLPDTGPDGSFVMDAGAYRDVRFNHRVLRAFWVSVFAGWEGYRASVNRTDTSRFAELLCAAQNILERDDPVAVALPDGIPEPGVFPDSDGDTEARAAAELAVFATGWALLHEVKHIQHQQAGTSASLDGAPESKHLEELSCDEFATRFILERSAEYAKQNNVDEALVKQKRQLGVHLALFALVILSRNAWSQSDNHPSIQVRMDRVWRVIDELGMHMPAAIIARLAFKALKDRWPASPFPVGRADP